VKANQEANLNARTVAMAGNNSRLQPKLPTMQLNQAGKNQTATPMPWMQCVKSKSAQPVRQRQREGKGACNIPVHMLAVFISVNLLCAGTAQIRIQPSTKV
jgi:hypothetical protein